MSKKLRSGYTTGACAAAAAKGAAALLLSKKPASSVTIPFPDGSRVTFSLAWNRLEQGAAAAGVIKDGGDDPDATNNALIVARVRAREGETGSPINQLHVVGGEGVGIVTKPGLGVEVGGPAINPVPMEMIRAAVLEAITEHDAPVLAPLEIAIEVPDGREIAKKTLNERLGIIGGISILGTTGIVRPVSAAAWTATISTSMDVAEAAGIEEIVLSTGRTSERCVQTILAPPEEALVMMGDYLEFALDEIRKRSFSKVHMGAMWAKLLKGAMDYPNTHVRHGFLEAEDAIEFLESIADEKAGIDQLRGSNTAREILVRLLESGQYALIDKAVSIARGKYCERAGVPVVIYLVDGAGTLLRPAG